MIKFLAALVLCFCTSVLGKPVDVPRSSPTSIQCMAWVIYDEARGESLRGARAVLDVVKARMKRDSLTACQVVMQPKQFSGYKRGQTFKVSNEQLTNYWIVARMQPVVKESTHFHAIYVSPSWAMKLKKTKRIDKHIFYK